MRKYRPVAKGGGALQAYREEMKERKRLRKRKMKTMVLKKVARQTKRLSQMYAVDFDSRVGPDDVQLLTKLDLKKEETVACHSALWSLMEHSFDASCIPHLAKLFRCKKGLNTAFLKINGSTVSCDGGIIYRVFRGPAWTATTVIEVLYLATHRAHRRRGAAHAMFAKFESLVTKIVDDLNEPAQIRLCVSMRGDDDGARAFWSKQNVKKLDKNDWLYDEMVLFGDYCPMAKSL